MEDLEFSDEFCRFLQSAVPAVEAAELLLLFQARPDSALSAPEAAARLGPGITLADTGRYLQQFEALGLLVRAGERFQYRPESEAARHVGTLSLAYAQRPVTLIRVIYALRDSKIKSFADAFRLRKD